MNFDADKNRKDCPECGKPMKFIRKKGHSVPISFDKDQKTLAWSSCSPPLMEYSYWECSSCKHVCIEQ